MSRPYLKIAAQYMADIESGKIPACKWVKLAVQRQRNDLKKAKTARYSYKFDEKKAERVCKFIEKLPHTKGKWARKDPKSPASNLIKLEPWQIFNLTTVFGWVKKKTKTRRFTTVYEEVPRKNGKSIKLAGVGLYMLTADGEYGAEVYSGATTEKQAWEVYRPAKLMAERAAGFKAHYGLSIFAKSISRQEDMSRFEPIVGDPGDGSSPSCALVDEYHEHDSSNLLDTMVTGMGARDQPLAWIITTSGYNVGGPCYQMRSDMMKMLEGVYDLDDTFAIIYTIDDNVDWTTPEALRMANPNFGVSVSEEFLLSEQKKAIQSAHLQNKFKTKHLNMWVSAKTAFFNLQHLSKCEDFALSIEPFRNEQAVASVDLSSKIDICVRLLLFRRMIDDQWHYYAFPRFYLPEETADDPGNQRYWGWVNDGHIVKTPGGMIDIDVIEDDLRADAETYELLEAAYDPWNASQMAGHLLDEGLNMVEVRATVQNFSDPMKQLEALIRVGRFHYDGNPVLRWMFSNVVAKMDNKDNVYPCKEKPENKIDGVVAIIMALGRMLANEGETGNIYEERFRRGEPMIRMI